MTRISDRRINLLAALAAAGAIAVAVVVLALSGASPRRSPVHPGPASSRLFAADSVWNAPLPASAPLSPRSATYTAELNQLVGHYGAWINSYQYSVPVYTVGAGQPLVPVTLDTGGGGAQTLAATLRAGVPIPKGAQPAAGNDEHMVVWQPSRDTFWEFWHAQLHNGVWHARWGGKMSHVSSNPGYFASPSYWGATATSLPLLGGLMRIDELRAGAIHHALALAIPHAAAGVYSFPAQRSDGDNHAAGAIPEGTRFRLDPRVNVAGLHLPPTTAMIALAAQRYGIIVRDQSGTVSFYAEDPRPTGHNPYYGAHGLFDNRYPSALLAGFPWHDLQVVATPRRAG